MPAPTYYRVPTLDKDSTAEDEIKALHKIAACAGRGSFLAELFNDAMLDWADALCLC